MGLIFFCCMGLNFAAAGMDRADGSFCEEFGPEPFAGSGTGRVLQRGVACQARTREPFLVCSRVWN